jgi:hypothetical protein
MGLANLRSQLSRTLVAIIAVLMWTGFTDAAEIQAVNYDCFFFDKCEKQEPDSILIRGTIVQGDAESFHSTVKKQGDFYLARVILRSNGGNAQEAMNIGRDIRTLLLETEGPYLDYLVDPDGPLSYRGGDFPACIENGIGEFKGSRYKGSECVCASACFLIYIAGAKRDRSYVGIHRSYLSESTSQGLGLNAETQLYTTIKKTIADYLDAMGVPRRYADIMLRTSSQEIYVPKYPEVMADFYGWVPEIEEWLIAKCKTISERQLEEEKNKAFNTLDRGQVMKFIELRDRREMCIQLELESERAKRRSEY